MYQDQYQGLFLKAFAMYFYRINAVEQKYQNLSQLYSRPLTLCMVVLFNIQTNKRSASFGGVMATGKSIIYECKYHEPGAGFSFDVCELVPGSA